MNVLILHHHFNTPQRGGAIRSYYLAKALRNKGDDVIIITTHNGKELKTEDVEGIKVHYLPIPYDNSFGFYRRSKSFLSYIFQVASSTQLTVKPDVCYAISVPLTIGIAARWLKFRHGIPYIFEVGDLWPDAPIELGFVKNPIFSQGLKTLERSIYNAAESIVALSTSIQSTIQRRAPSKRIHLLPNMADTDFFRDSGKTEALETKFGVSGKFVVSYIGALGFANGLDYFLECARASQKANLPIHFLLCGEGAKRMYLEETIKKLSLTNISMLPFRNRDGVREILQVTDAVFICYRHVPVLETGSPNKYFDGLAAGKAIVINFGGWIKEEIEREGCGCSVDPQQPADFVRVIKPMVEDGELLQHMKKSSRALAEKKYSRQILSEKFVSSIIHAR